MFTTRSVHDAITERSPAYAILAIDSEDRFRDYAQANATPTGAYNGSPYDFQITKNESIMNGFFTRLAVTEVCFPWQLPNITERTQEVAVEWKVGVGPVQSNVVTIQQGFWKPSQLATQFQAQIAALPGLGAFTMGYGTPPTFGENAIFHWETNTPGTVIRFLPLPYNSAVYPFPNTTKQLFNLMGFDYASTIFDTDDFGRSTFCQNIRYVDIVCGQLTYNQALKDTMTQPVARDTLCRL